MSFAIEAIRGQFPGLARTVGGQPAVFFDGPAGSQVPRRVIDAMAHYMATANANSHGAFVTSVETDELVLAARAAAADFFGIADADLVAFGPNMTTLTFSLSRAIGRTLAPEDEVIVTRLDHDANITPWLMAARDAGAKVHQISFRREDTTLDLDELAAKLSPRTRLVAVGAASNATGTKNPIAAIARLAHEAGAQVYVDAVHYAPHARMEADAWQCDYAVCSAYKFFGPHLGLLVGKRAAMTELPAYQVRPASGTVPDRWCVGTQSFEAIAGTLEAILYLEDLGRAAHGSGLSRVQALSAAFEAIERYERKLLMQLLDGLAELPAITVWGIRDPGRIAERMPTVAFTHARRPAKEVAARLAERGIFVWAGNYYAVDVTRELGLEPDGMVRVGLLHYNTETEVERLLAALRELG